MAKYIDKEFLEKYMKENPDKVIFAEKVGAVLAVRATEDGEIKTYTADGNLESVTDCKKGDWVLTAADKDGNAKVDKNGRTNTWVMKAEYDEQGNIVMTADEKMQQKYDMANRDEETGFVKPKGKTQTFVLVQGEIDVPAPWEKEGFQPFPNGAWINVTNLNDIYGIAPGEFKETYAEVAAPVIDVELEPHEVGVLAALLRAFDGDKIIDDQNKNQPDNDAPDL